MTARLARAILVLTLMSSWAAAAAVAQESTPPPSATGDAGAGGPTLWLRGPFGKVAGGSMEDPASAPPLDQPLDTFVRRAPLLLEMDDPALLPSLEVVAKAVGAHADQELLSHGVQAFEGPSNAGPQLIVATIPVGDQVIQRAWLVDVPDREPPDDGLYDVPAPEIVVSTAAGSKVGVLGDGCYVYLCVETGRATPPAGLEPLEAVAGETPALGVGDGSALVAWEGRLAPIGRTQGEAREAAGVVTDLPTYTVPLIGLEAPGPGEWLLDVEVVLDRERGWLRTAYRIVVDEEEVSTDAPGPSE